MADSRVRPEDEGEEAAKENQQVTDMESAETTTAKEKVAEETARKSIWDCGSPLYDSYELVSVTHVIERHWMIFPYQAASSNNSSSHQTLRKSTSSQKTVMNTIMKTKAKTKKNKTGGEGRNKNKETTSGVARWFCCFWGNN